VDEMQPVIARASVTPREGAVRRGWLAAAAAAVAAVVVAAVTAGWDIGAWLGAFWDSLTSISPLYLVPALALQTLQTAFAAAAWHGILRIALAAVLVAVAFGRSGGKRLVKESSARARELQAQRDDAALRGGATS
jgi:hypothetical protein